MRLTDHGLETYLSDVADLLERYGLEPDSPGQGLTIDEAVGARRLAVRAFPPGVRSTTAGVELRETWVGDGTGSFERSEYAYELVDQLSDFRRAFHMHFPEWFRRRFLVVVHEHCERPIGRIDCEHFEGTPIRDAFAGVLAIVDVWTGEAPDCSALRCLE